VIDDFKKWREVKGDYNPLVYAFVEMLARIVFSLPHPPLDISI
jgi:hypothetical protein